MFRDDFISHSSACLELLCRKCKKIVLLIILKYLLLLFLSGSPTSPQPKAQLLLSPRFFKNKKVQNRLQKYIITLIFGQRILETFNTLSYNRFWKKCSKKWASNHSATVLPFLPLFSKSFFFLHFFTFPIF